jgi:anti-sigma regulatory factor (Ser/Thr protein kinase)
LFLVTETDVWPSRGAFEHPLMLGRGDEAFARLAVDFLAAGLRLGEEVAAAVPASRFGTLRAAFGTDIRLFDLTDSGRNPGRIIPLVLCAFAEAHPGRTLRVLQEPMWPGRTELEYPACVQHEALTNMAFAGKAMTVACFYDTGALGPSMLADARSTHPTLFGDKPGAPEAEAYSPAAAYDRFDLPLPEPPITPSEMAFDHSTQELTRTLAARSASAADFTDDRGVDVELVVNELTANSIAHGGGTGSLRIWAEKDALVCEVTDHGRLADPLAGRRPAGLSVTGGRGLLLVNCLADLVRTHSGPDGLTVRAYFTR